MRVFALGLSHRTAPIAVREKAAFTRAELPHALQTLNGALDNAVILSTCNRTELYAVAPEADGVQETFTSLLSRKTSLAEEELSSYLAFYEQEQAVRHLFEVASGLDSLILGESQVLGQVREAYSSAVNQGSANGLISKVFHHALRVGKRARRETRIGENALSISSAAVEAARDTLGDLSRSQVAVVGAGEAGKLVAKAMKDRGVGRMTVVNRTLERAQDLAQELEAEAAPLELLPELLGKVDIVVSSTDYQGIIITTEMVDGAMSQRNGNPLLVVDIAMPRDADPAIGRMPGVSLLDMDDLQSVSRANRLEREKEVSQVESIIDQEVGKFGDWWDSLRVAPGIAQLREHAEALRIREIKKTLKQLPNLTDEDAARIEALSRSIVKKLLHNPIATIKENPGYMETAQRMFGLNDKNS